jgi:diacylglycerol kinase family enzyme
MFDPTDIPSPPENAGKALLLLHPGSRRHQGFGGLLKHFYQTFDLKVKESRHAGHIREICREHLGDFQGVVLTAGGDGTLHEAVNGWADLGFPEGPRFAPLPLGTGNDFLYSANPEFRHLKTFYQRPLTTSLQADLARVTFRTPEGESSRYFCVGATCGFSALVTFRRAILARHIPGTASYLLALFLSLGSWRNTPVRVQSPEQSFEHQVFFNLNCANVKYYGGGMVSAPRADAFAGRLDGVAMNLTLPEVLKALPQNFRGNFDAVRNVHQFSFRGPLTVTPARTCLVQADGERLGETPMTVECLPAGLPVLLPALPRAGNGL